jgi:hypothetical protein
MRLRQLSFTAWPITEQAARIIVLKMLFKTPLAFAVVAAISAGGSRAPLLEVVNSEQSEVFEAGIIL